MKKNVSLTLDQMVEKLLQLKEGESFDFAAGHSTQPDWNKEKNVIFSYWYSAKVIQEIDRNVLILGNYKSLPTYSIPLDNDDKQIYNDIIAALKSFDKIDWLHEGCYIKEEPEIYAKQVPSEYQNADPHNLPINFDDYCASFLYERNIIYTKMLKNIDKLGRKLTDMIPDDYNCDDYIEWCKELFNEPFECTDDDRLLTLEEYLNTYYADSSAWTAERIGQFLTAYVNEQLAREGKSDKSPEEYIAEQLSIYKEEPYEIATVYDSNENKELTVYRPVENFDDHASKVIECNRYQACTKWEVYDGKETRSVFVHKDPINEIAKAEWTLSEKIHLLEPDVNFPLTCSSLTQQLLDEIPEECLTPVWNYDYCEFSRDFVGFIDKYAQLNIPKDFTVIDVGCNQAVQAHYFKDHSCYIGIDPAIPVENRLIQGNADYYRLTAQDFIKTVLPKLIEDGLDLHKTFAICSAVPDDVAQELVINTFPYHQVTYPCSGQGLCTDIISRELPPEPKKTKHKSEIDR